MAIATCVLTCRSWFCMSRITCLIIFSGSSALSMRSLRFARTKVATRSSSAMVDSLLQLPAACFLLLANLRVGPASRFMRPMDRFALRALRLPCGGTRGR